MGGNVGYVSLGHEALADGKFGDGDVRDELAVVDGLVPLYFAGRLDFALMVGRGIRHRADESEGYRVGLSGPVHQVERKFVAERLSPHIESALDASAK